MISNKGMFCINILPYLTDVTLEYSHMFLYPSESGAPQIQSLMYNPTCLPCLISEAICGVQAPQTFLPSNKQSV